MRLRRFWLLTFSALLLIPFLSIESFSDDEGSFITTDKESYSAGEPISVTGQVAISSGSPVIIQVLTPLGTYAHIAQITPDSENNFSEDIATSIGGKWKASGTYIIKATHYYGSFETQFEYGGMMSAQMNPSTETSSESEDGVEFGIGGTIDPFAEGTSVMQLEDYEIFYKITGAKILKIYPLPEDKSLMIEIETFSDGELTITLPKQIIDTNEGSFFVLVDGEETNHDASSTLTSWTLTIPFYNGTEDIEIIGTFVIPEFGTIAAIILAVAITSIIVLSAKTKLSIMPKL